MNSIFPMFLFILLLVYSSSSSSSLHNHTTYLDFKRFDADGNEVIDRNEFRDLESVCLLRHSEEVRRRRRRLAVTCEIIGAPFAPNAFDAGTSCTQANVGGTCEYFCDSPNYFIDNLTVSMFEPISKPGFPPNTPMSPNLRYCAQTEISPGVNVGEWYTPEPFFVKPRCLNQNVYDKLIHCTNKSTISVYTCDTMRSCFIEDETGGSCTSLDFSGSNFVLYNIYDGFFESTPNVKSVDFTSNYLGLNENLRPDTFQPISNVLMTLIMEDNYIGDLGVVFQGLPHLTSVNIRSNVITEITVNAFRDSDSIQILSLDDNRIGKIENGAFANLVSLRSLELQNNMLTSLNSGTFSGNLSSIKMVDVSSNRITSFHRDTFTGLSSSLRKLHLSNNLLTQIEPGSFSNLNLVRLTLHKNQLHSLMNGIFMGMIVKSGVGEIDMSDNPIVEIYENSIQDTICDTARFVLSTSGTSWCNCQSGNVVCQCRGGSIALSADSNTPAGACRIPNITSVGVLCSETDENGCDRNGNIMASSGPFLTSLQNEVVAFDALLNKNVEHTPPSTEGGDFLILNFNQTENYRIFSNSTSTTNVYLRLEDHEGTPCTIQESKIKCGIPEGVGFSSSLFLTVAYNDSFEIENTFDIFQLDDFAYGVPKVLSISGCPDVGCDREGNNTIEIHGTNFGMSDALIFVNREVCKEVIHGSLSLRENGGQCIGASCHRSLTCLAPPLAQPQSNTADIKNTVNVVQANLNGFADQINASFEYRACLGGEVQYEDPKTLSHVICEPCDTGSYSTAEDAISCVLCGTGKFQSNPAQTQCDECPVNFFASYEGLAECEGCAWGKSTDGSTGQTSCNPCSFAYLLSTHCETPWMAVILGIVGFFVLLILLRLGYKRRLMYLRDRAALQQEREAAKKNKMRDRINLKKLWTEHVVDNLKIGTDITKFVDVELHASPHAEEVVLGHSYDTHMKFDNKEISVQAEKVSMTWMESDNDNHLVICKNFKCDSFSFSTMKEFKNLRRLTRHARIAYMYGWISSQDVGISHRVLTEFLEGRSLQDLMSGTHRHHNVSRSKEFYEFKHNETRFTWGQTLQFAIDITEGLQWLHENFICHGNLKPSNVLVTAKQQDGKYRRAKLTDAYFLRHGSKTMTLSKENPDAHFVKHLRNTFSSEAWIDPNLLFYAEIDDLTFQLSPKSDVYSLGILLRDLGACCDQISSAKTNLLTRTARSMTSNSLKSDSSIEKFSPLTPSSKMPSALTMHLSSNLKVSQKTWNQLIERCTRNRDIDRPSTNWVQRRLINLSKDTPTLFMTSSVGTPTGTTVNLDDEISKITEMEDEKVEEDEGDLILDTGAPSASSFPISPDSS